MANIAPDGTDNTIAVNPVFGYTFGPDDFGFTDLDGGQFTSIRFDTVPQNGQILVNGDTIVEAGDVFQWVDITSLSYAPGLGASGAGFASFTFSVSDGTDFDPVPNTITFDASSPPNSPPTFGETLGGTVNFTEGGAPVVLDGAVSIFDAELAASGAYEGAVLTLERATGANPDDVFGSAQFEEQSTGTGNVKFFDGVDLNTVGTYSLVDGVLTIVFFSNATQAAVDAVLSSLTYTNTSENPPESVEIDWTFYDANDAGAPAGLSATGTTTVSVEAVNDAPVITSSASQSLVENIAGSFALRGFDAEDGDVTFTIVDGIGDGALFSIVGAPGAQSLALAAQDYEGPKQSFTVRVRVTDSGDEVTEQDITVAIENQSDADVDGDGLANALQGSDEGTEGGSMDAGAGNDLIYARGGDDWMLGGDGNDMLFGGLGADTHDGGTGIDYARYNDAAYGDLVISLIAPETNTGAAAGDTYISIEGIIGGTGNDDITGNGNANFLYGMQGNDTIDGDGGNDRVFGDGGDDELYGGVGADTVDGGVGNDVLYGGRGKDRLIGGEGDDMFVFTGISDTGVSAATRDVIADFGAGDTIDLTGIDAFTGSGGALGDQAFLTLLGPDANGSPVAFSGPQQLRYYFVGLDTATTADDITVIEGKTSPGGQTFQFQIELTGIHQLQLSADGNLISPDLPI